MINMLYLLERPNFELDLYSNFYIILQFSWQFWIFYRKTISNTILHVYEGSDFELDLYPLTISNSYIILLFFFGNFSKKLFKIIISFCNSKEMYGIFKFCFYKRSKLSSNSYTFLSIQILNLNFIVLRLLDTF